MADEKLIAQGLEALEGLIGLVLEDALDQAIAQPPTIHRSGCAGWLI